MKRAMQSGGETDLTRGRTSEVLSRATGLQYVVVETRDLDASERFFADFGLTTCERQGDAVYMRAAEASPYVLKLLRARRGRLASMALRVESELELRRLASLPGASIEERREPGGGGFVRLIAPGGLIFEAVYGVEQGQPLPLPSDSAPANVSGALTRVGTPVRVAPAPSQVLRLGHVALETPNPTALVLWLMRTFGMIVSDYQSLEDGPDALPVTSFIRCDRGETPSDHHTLAVALSPIQRVSHIAFEVRDVDEIGRGAAFLRARGHHHTWGLGRHVLGSQLFDYWRSPDGIVAEHYCDGDVFSAASPTGRLAFQGSNLSQWGGPAPLGLALHTLTPRVLAEAARSLLGSDVSPATFLRALRAMSR